MREATWVAVGTALTALATLVGNRVVTEFVRKDIWGVVLLLLGVFNISRNIVCYPVLQAQMQLYPEFAAAGRLWQLRRTGGKMVVQLVALVMVAMLIGGAIWSHLKGLSFWAFVVVAVITALDAARSFETNLLGIARRQRALSFLTVAEAVIKPLTILAVIFLFSVSTPSVLVGNAIPIAIALWMALKLIRPEGSDRPADLPSHAEEAELRRRIWRYAIPLVPLAITGWVTNLSDRYIIGGLLGAGQVGIYGATYALISQPFMMAYGIVLRTTTPVYYEAVTSRNIQRQRTIFRATLLAVVGICGGGFLLLCLLRHPIAWLLLAPEYRSGITLFPWIAAGYALFAVGQTYEMRLYATGRTDRILWIESLTAATALIIPLLLIPRLGLLGGAIACPMYFGIRVLAAAWLSRDSEGRGTPPGGGDPGTSIDATDAVAMP